jgi:hypothetical protein
VPSFRFRNCNVSAIEQTPSVALHKVWYWSTVDAPGWNAELVGYAMYECLAKI